MNRGTKIEKLILGLILMIICAAVACKPYPRYRAGGSETPPQAAQSESGYTTNQYLRLGAILQNYLGKPYSGRSKYVQGLDCSYFVADVFEKFDKIPLPRTVKEQFKTGRDVYLFKNDRGKIIYVGKAKNLRNRVRTYFQSPHRHDHKTARMVPQVVDLDLMVTDSEVEALILEANLVHEYKPRYNVALKDDKHFPYIKITNEPFPRVLIVRRIEKDDATYFGPYTSAKGMRRTVAFLTRLFNIRTCNLIIPAPEGKTHQVCLDYHIKRCAGPCVGLQLREDYAQQVEAVAMVLSGKSKELIDRLTEKMKAASASINYEEAAKVRDQIEAIKSVMIKQKVDAGDIVDRDIISLAREEKDAVAVVMQIREGVLIGRQDFQITSDTDDPNEEVLETFITQYYNHQPNLPDELYLPYELPEKKLVEQWLKEVRGSRVKVYTPRIGEKVRLVDLAAKNARLLLDEILTSLQDQRRQRAGRLQDDARSHRSLFLSHQRRYGKDHRGGRR
jgi:excinuclease ABC subunit C